MGLVQLQGGADLLHDAAVQHHDPVGKQQRLDLVTGVLPRTLVFERRMLDGRRFQVAG